ncbi:MAG: AAA family ATPase, partial [Acidimicrobiia bacterium]
MITHIALENWRAYRSLDLDVEAGTTFLVAPNGIGKSSLLEAVRWALAGGHVEARPSMVRKGHTAATVAVTVALPAGPLVVTRALSVARAKPVATTTATLAGVAVDESEALRLLEESWTADARFVSRTAFLTEDLRRDTDDPNLRTHLCRAYSLDDLQRAIAEIEPVLATLSKGLKASRAELSGTREQLDQAVADVERRAAETVAAQEVVEAARTASAEIRAALDQARDAAVRHAAAIAWREGRDRILSEAAPVVPDVVEAAADRPLDAALAAAEDRLGAEVEALRREQAALRARLDAAEAALATLHDAGAACPTCLRELDDASRARAEDVHRLTVENASDHLARLDEATTPALLDAVRALARAAAALGPAPDDAEPADLDALVAADRQAGALVEAAAAGLREAELEHAAAEARVAAIRADLEAADALTGQYRAEAILEAGKTALHNTVTAVLGRQLEPLAAEVNRRWEAVFPDRPNLHLTPDGQMTRVIDDAALEFGAFSAGEQTVAKLMMRLTTLLSTTTVPFCWIDEPLEHLDPSSRQLVASTLAHLSAGGGLEQIFVTTYEEPLARRLAELQPGRVRVQYLRTSFWGVSTTPDGGETPQER